MFTYQDLQKELELFAQFGCEVGSIGESALSQRIPYIYVGKDKKNCIIVQGAIHAREHITALLVVCTAKYMLQRSDLALYGGIYFIPMVNPDGVRLCQEGVNFISDASARNHLIALNGGSGDFSLWKANARGVDLNVNFDANWSKGSQNVFAPAPQNYVGKNPFSEKESKCLADFTHRIMPKATISYHCKGEVVYWRYNQDKIRLWRDYRIAKGIAKATGYALAESADSHGGYKDWCIDKLKIPSYTIEVGSDEYEYPYPYEDFFNILHKNQDIPRRVVNTLAAKKNPL